MLGILRFLLAVGVMLTHLGGIIVGHFAVYCFYMLSGMLITAALHDVYDFDLRRFATNRFLRLFPIYYLVAALSIVATFMVPGHAVLNRALTLPTSSVEIFSNLTLAPFALNNAFVSVRLVPPAWSVGVELVCYALLWLFVGRSKSGAFCVLLLAAAYHVTCFSLGLGFSWRYIPVMAALLPFSAGALIYLYRDKATTSWLNFFIFSVAWVLNLTFCAWYPDRDLSFYFNMVAFAGMLFSQPRMEASFLKKIGSSLGELSYPIFLCHWLVGTLVASFFGTLFHQPGYGLFMVSIVPVFIVSFSLAKISDVLIEPIRNRVRGSERRETSRQVDNDGLPAIKGAQSL